MVRKGILLLSGGFDSPVAGYLMARQGLDVVAAHFSLEPITDDTAALKTRALCAILDVQGRGGVRGNRACR